MLISWKTNDLCLVAAGALFALIFTFVGLRHAIVSYRHHIFEISESLSHVGKYQRNVQHLPPPTPEAGSHTSSGNLHRREQFMQQASSIDTISGR